MRRAIETYLAGRKARNTRAGAEAETRLAHHVLSSTFADLSVAGLTDADFTAWRKGLRRGGRARTPGTAPLAAATLARLFNDVRAALLAAARKARLPADVLTTITIGCKRPDGATQPRMVQVLSEADLRRLVEAARQTDDDFGALVMALAATGARLNQASRITVADFRPGLRRIMVPVSHMGRGPKPKSHIAVPIPDDVVSLLRSLAAGREGHAPLLMRWRHRQVAGDRIRGRLPGWERVDRAPWRSPSEMTRPWKAALKIAGLPDDLVPYGLRHTSIVRGLRAGLPVRLVAAAHDTNGTTRPSSLTQRRSCCGGRRFR